MTGTPEDQKALEKLLEDMEKQCKSLQKGKAIKDNNIGLFLRSKKGGPTSKMFPVVVRGQNLEYKPWQNSDLSDILEKLPILQEGAHPWISKL